MYDNYIWWDWNVKWKVVFGDLKVKVWAFLSRWADTNKCNKLNLVKTSWCNLSAITHVMHYFYVWYSSYRMYPHWLHMMETLCMKGSTYRTVSVFGEIVLSWLIGWLVSGPQRSSISPPEASDFNDQQRRVLIVKVGNSMFVWSAAQRPTAAANDGHFTRAGVCCPERQMER